MTFDATAPVGTFQDALEPLTTIVDECKIRLEEGGLSARACDPANVAMCDVSLPERAFESYQADGGVIGVNLERIEDVVGMGSAGDLAHLSVNEQTRKLHIEIGGLSYTLALIDPASIRQEPDIPDLDLPAGVAFEGSDLSRSVSAAGLVSDRISMAADPQAHEFIFAAEGDTDDVDVTLDADDLATADVSERAESLFSLNYVEDMVRPIGSDVIVSFSLGSEMPVKFSYTNGDVRVENLLAPRVESS